MEAQEIALKLTGLCIVPEENLLKQAKPWARITGIYFLIDSGEIVYVGQSKTAYSRISSHTTKKFDSIAYVQCEERHLDVIESIYIHSIKPRLNYTQANGIKSAPLSPKELEYLATTKATK